MGDTARRLVVVAIAGVVALSLPLGCTEEPEETIPLTFIQFFDPHCEVCAEMEPTVEKVEAEYADRLETFEIIDVTTDEGRDQVEEFGVFVTPTFVVLDAEGEELDRITGACTEEALVSLVERGISDVSGE